MTGIGKDIDCIQRQWARGLVPESVTVDIQRQQNDIVVYNCACIQ